MWNGKSRLKNWNEPIAMNQKVRTKAHDFITTSQAWPPNLTSSIAVKAAGKTCPTQMIAREISLEACSEPGHGAPCINQRPTTGKTKRWRPLTVWGRGPETGLLGRPNPNRALKPCWRGADSFFS